MQTNIRIQDSNYSLKLFGVHPPTQIGKFIFTEKIHVRWYAREIHFDLFDIDLQEKIGSDGNILQYPVAHEFGHTIGLVKFSRPLLSFNPNYPWGTLHADEYETNSSKENKFRRPFINDRRSIMNIGNELRERHMDYILQELNTLLLGTEFYISTLLK